MRLVRTFLVMALLFVPAPYSRAEVTVYKLDKEHTSVGFKIKHLLSWTTGTFNQFEGTIQYDPENPEAWKVDATIDASSIDTGVEQRDKHLRSADFFDVEQFPTLKFQSTGVTDVSENSAKVQGDLTIHGVTKPVTLDVEIHGMATDPWGNERIAATATTKINRKDFGLEWNKTLETGQFLVGEEVRITIEVEGIKP